MKYIGFAKYLYFGKCRSLLIFEEKFPNYASELKSAPNIDSFWMRRLFNECVRVFCWYGRKQNCQILDVRKGYYFVFQRQQSIRSAKYLFFENALKKVLNIFSNFFFYLKVQSFRLIMENNFIQIAASIFKHIIVCVQQYFTNGFTNIVL